jgi:hypothetical protein
MSVAPSFQKYPIADKPYEKNNRWYVHIQYPDGHLREVRWYPEAEEEVTMKRIRSVKEVLGFSEGYITIFKGDTYPLLEWFQNSTARFHKFWGWYFVSEDELPQIPAGIEPKKLLWEDVSFPGEDALRPESVIADAVARLQYDESPSEHQGSIGERIDRELTVIKAITSDGFYGTSTMHIFEDADKNQYIWSTSAKCLEEGSTYQVRGTVKSHDIYRNTKQTILTRCSIK